MKKWVIFLFLLLIPLSLAQYEIKGYVNDYANVLTPFEENEISSILKEIHDSGVAEYAVVTVPSLEGQDIEGFSYNIAEGNLGDTEKNNGLLLLVAIEDRQYRLEVGRGLEPVIPDIIAGRIGRTYLVPHFREENYAQGIKEASLAVRDVLFEDYEGEYYPKEEKFDITPFIPFIIFWTIFIIIMITSMRQSYKKYKKKHRDDKDYIFAAWMLSNMMKGGGRGGFSGGGFGGFGGGSFGGGGASSGW